MKIAMLPRDIAPAPNWIVPVLSLASIWFIYAAFGWTGVAVMGVAPLGGSPGLGGDRHAAIRLGQQLVRCPSMSVHCLLWVRFDLDVDATCVRRSAEGPGAHGCARVRLSWR